MRGIWLTLALVLSSTSALAKSHFLPDYQGAGLDGRVQEFENPHTTNTCSVYGMYNSIQSGMTCSVTYPAAGLTCYTCQPCDSAYKYTTVECPTPTYSLSDQCGGKYKTCSCNVSLYPTTSATTGCPRSLIPDTEDYCEDKPDGTKHYACVRPVCKPDNITVEECQAKGDGHNCTASKEANCTDYCDSNGCQDNCTYLKQTGQARSDCQYGCAAGKDVSDCSDLCYECGEAPESPTNTCVDIYDGKSNTTAIINQLGADALAATAANQYRVGDEATFSRGQWYLPSIGELVDMYGADPEQITSGSGKTGATGGYIERINEALTVLHNRGDDADIISGNYWSSSENSRDSVWTLTVSSANGSGNRSAYSKDFDYKVRPFLQVKSCFNTSGSTIPTVGDVMYRNKDWGRAGRYYANEKTPAGIIVSVNKTDGSVKIVGLKNLTFNSTDSSGNFDADNPYVGMYEESVWAPYDKREANVIGVPNYSSDQLKTMLKKCAAKEEEISCPIDKAMLSAIFDGKYNTQMIVAQFDNEALAAYAATQFYVGDKNGAFGQGNWYLPAIGELIDMYGIDTSKMIGSARGAVGDNKAKINAALTTLKSKGAEAEVLSGTYRSSSEFSSTRSWVLMTGNGLWYDAGKDSNFYVRPFKLLENCFDSTSDSSPEIGDVMYADKTWGSANDYDGSKTPVGIVVAVSTVSGSVKIVSIKDLTFSSASSIGSFNPDNPYGGNTKYTYWVTNTKSSENVTDLQDISEEDTFTAFKNCPVYEW